jgi:hypothetical protein
MAIEIVKQDKKQTEKTFSKTKKGKVSKGLSSRCMCQCPTTQAKADQVALVK